MACTIHRGFCLSELLGYKWTKNQLFLSLLPREDIFTACESHAFIKGFDSLRVQLQLLQYLQIHKSLVISSQIKLAGHYVHITLYPTSPQSLSSQLALEQMNDFRGPQNPIEMRVSLEDFTSSA